MDNDAEAAEIRECFFLNEIVPVASTLERLGANTRFAIVGLDFYGAYWTAPEKVVLEKMDSKTSQPRQYADFYPLGNQFAVQIITAESQGRKGI